MELNELMEKATAIGNVVEGFKAEQAEKTAELSESLEALKKQQATMEKKMLALQQKGGLEGATAQVTKTLADQFLNSEDYKAFLAKGSPMKVTLDMGDYSVNLNAPVKSDSGHVQPERDPFVLQPVAKLAFKGAFGAVPTTSSAIQVVCEKKFTSAAAYVAEAGAFPASGLETEVKLFKVVKIAHFIPVTRETLEDAPEIADILNVRLPEAVNLKLEAEMLQGAGGDNAIGGLLGAGNHLAHGFDQKKLGKDATLVDLVTSCVASLRAVNRNPSHVFLNPMDLNAIKLLKDKQGRRLWEGNPWGLEIVETPSMPAGKFLVGDVSGAGLRMRREVEIEIGRSGNDFTEDKFTMLASCRAAFVIRDPNAFVGGDLAIPANGG